MILKKQIFYTVNTYCISEDDCKGEACTLLSRLKARGLWAHLDRVMNYRTGTSLPSAFPTNVHATSILKRHYHTFSKL